MFIEYSKLVYFTDTDILESLTTVNKPYKVDVKMYKTTWSWLHFTYSVIFYQWPHTYSDCKTARIFAEVKNARVSGHTKSLEREGDWVTERDWTLGRVRLAPNRGQTSEHARRIAWKSLRLRFGKATYVWLRLLAGKNREIFFAFQESSLAMNRKNKRNV